ncbi:MAG: hypothetical protein HY901_00210 [Deltaproteobacteria bacterium]|nr:hypothetical protein [Deltaproteobacteria bacterium]
MSRVALTACLVSLALLPDAARAGSVVALLSDPKVAQFQEAMEGARESLGALSEIAVGAKGWEAELKQQAPAVVLVVGQKALQVARASLPGTPIVYCMVFQKDVLVSPPVTGVPLEVSIGSQLAELRRVAPALRRIGLIYDPQTSSAQVEEATKAATVAGLTLRPKGVADPRDVQAAVAEMAGQVEALWLLPAPRLITKEVFSYLLVFTLEHRIALYGFLESFTRAGALASVSADYREIGRRAGELAAGIAAKPAEKRLPVPPVVFSQGAVTLNLKTAARLGLQIPDEAVARARQVFR